MIVWDIFVDVLGTTGLATLIIFISFMFFILINDQKGE
jgi:hypothetical protein